MKLCSLLITCLFAGSLFAQGTNPAPTAGGAPAPTQGSPNQPPPPPPPKDQKPPTDGKAWSAEKCQKQMPRLQKAAENCLRIAKEPKRKACFEGLQKAFPAGFMEACREQIEPLKAEMEAKEKAKYPQQNSATTGEGHGDKQQHGQTPPPAGEKKADCGKIANEIRKHADQCLQTKDQAKRKACFDKIGQKIHDSGAEQSCGPVLDQLKSEYQAKESQMYPGQPSSL